MSLGGMRDRSSSSADGIRLRSGIWIRIAHFCHRTAIFE